MHILSICLKSSKLEELSILALIVYTVHCVINPHGIYQLKDNMRQSALVTKTRKLLSEQEVSINARLLERAGFISKLMAGVYSFLPMGFECSPKLKLSCEMR